MIDIEKPNELKVVKLAQNIDYLNLFYLLRRKFSSVYLFESLSIPKKQERYFTFGFDPKYIFRANRNSLSIQTKDKTHVEEVENPYFELKKYLPSFPKSNSYQGGMIGHLSYEAVKYFEKTLDFDEHEDFHNFEFGLYYDGLIYDQQTKSLEYYTYGQDRSEVILRLFDHIQDTKLPSHIKSIEKTGYNIDENQYKQIVESTLEEIKKGNTFQAEVGVRASYIIEGDKFALYNKLRQVNPSPYMYYIKFEDSEIFGSSPELVVSSKSKKVLTTPAAGTIARGSTTDEDRIFGERLLSDEKEIAEHAMLVDMHRNDISKVCKPGSVVVSDLMHLMKFSFVQHIVSDITGELMDDKDSFDLLASIMPCGVLTGAPKVETMKIIHRNENTPRGPYGGAVGRFSFNGDCAFAMPIRSLFCKGDRCFTQSSAGIVYDSNPDNEYKEVIAKLMGLEQTIKEVST